MEWTAQGSGGVFKKQLKREPGAAVYLKVIQFI